MEPTNINLTEEELFAFKYPVGKFTQPEVVTEDDHKLWTGDLEDCPSLLKNEIAGWTEEKWDTPYRPGGWTARQLVHHIADSHTNAIIRVKLALTENEPIIKPYIS